MIGKEIIEESKKIIAQYSMALTLRQLYYRLVASQKIENRENNYKYLSKLLVKARLNGEIPFSAIEDRSRKKIEAWDASDEEWTPERYFGYYQDEYEGAEEEFKGKWRSYTHSRWYKQPNTLVVLLEKDALSALFSAVTERERINLYPLRGYSSLTFVKQIADDLEGEENIKILYFGDFDPSGMDIQRYLKERLRDEFDVDADVRRVAITDEQIQKYNIPPAPAKRSDTRFNGFVGEHGDRAVELDAIEPDVLQEIIKNSIQALFDEKIYQEQKSEQKEKQQEIKKMIEEYFGDDLNE